MLNCQEKKYFCKENERKKYSDERFSPKKKHYFDFKVETLAPPPPFESKW